MAKIRTIIAIVQFQHAIAIQTATTKTIFATKNGSTFDFCSASFAGADRAAATKQAP